MDRNTIASAIILPTAGICGSAAVALLAPEVMATLFGGPLTGYAKIIVIALLASPMALAFLIAEMNCAKWTKELGRAREPQ